MADYARYYEPIRAAGGELAAISVDRADQAAGMKDSLALPFPILCDTDRKLIRAWDLVNHAEGDIARPAAFVIDRNLRVLWRTEEGHSQRADPSAVARMVADLGAGRAVAAEPGRHTIWPGAMFLRAAMNVLARGFKTRPPAN